MRKYVFVIGGVMSSVGKGVTVASIASILQFKGYSVTAMKIDPYVNVDAGTMNPTEHGEVFVTNDGDETDQDIGNYERFLNTSIYKQNYMTTGRVYLSVIEKERNLAYKGKCVEVVPHIPQEVITRIKKASQKNKADVTVIEIGGTIGEYQNILFLEAARMMKLEAPNSVIFVLVSYLPIPSRVGEMKTKPTQYAARSLNATGIQPDFIICRAANPLDEPRIKKISTFCSVQKDYVISAPDVDNIYKIPIIFEEAGLSKKIIKKLKLRKKEENLEKRKKWENLVYSINKYKKKIKIGILGKYFEIGKFTLTDVYISVIEAIKHACWANKVKPELDWLNAEKYEKNPELIDELKQYDAVVVPGGFGSRGVEGIIKSIQFLRENKIPYLGLCYGMQLAAVEFARNKLGLKNANTIEINPKTEDPIIDFIPGQKKNIKHKAFGGTLRLGACKCIIRKDSKSYKAYQKTIISERHRHRYEFNNKYRNVFEENGMKIIGTSPNNKLVEIIEYKDHPFFVGVQFHPEFKSRFLNPSPLFYYFIKIAKNNKI